MSFSIFFILLFGYLYIAYVFSLQFIPERAVIYYANDSLIKNAAVNVRKLGRKGGYVVNLNFTLINDAGNNITADIIFFEYLHNEYKRSFVEMHFRLCDMINNDKLVGMAVRIAGMTSCPLKAGTYALHNMTIPNVENFPYRWPFERGRADGNFLNPKTGVVVGNGSIYYTFKQKFNSMKP